MSNLVRDFEESGQNRKEFARAHGLTESKLYYWISKLPKVAQCPEAPLASFQQHTKIRRTAVWISKGIKPIVARMLTKYLQLYLNEFVYKFNRRYFEEGLFDRLIIAGITGL